MKNVIEILRNTVELMFGKRNIIPSKCNFEYLGAFFGHVAEDIDAMLNVSELHIYIHPL